MTRDEAKKIVMIIASTFPNWRPNNLSFTVDAWTAMLEEYSYTQIGAALHAYIKTDSSGFAPSVGQLIGLIDRATNKEDLNEMEAWSMVSKALRNGIYGAETEFDKLPETVQRAVGSPEMLRSWALSDMKSIETVIQSNFQRTYREVLKIQTEQRKIPQKVQNLLHQVNQKMIGVDSNGTDS